MSKDWNDPFFFNGGKLSGFTDATEVKEINPKEKSMINMVRICE
jgi:hypothetical protein